MTIFQGYDGELRIYDYGINGTTYYIEILFCDMNFSGPLQRGRNEERLVMDRGRFDGNAHYAQGDDTPRYAPYPFSFSCRLADTANTRSISDLFSGTTHVVNANGGTTTLYSWGGKTTITSSTGALVTVPNFSDTAKTRYRVEVKWDGSSDYGLRYEECYFAPDQQTINESADGLVLNVNGQVYGDVTRITSFYAPAGILAFN